MRWLLLLALLPTTGCFNFSCEIPDPCPGHGIAGWFEASNCSCPLASEIGPQLEGKRCSHDYLVCSDPDDWNRSCLCNHGEWSCGAMDFSVPRDLSPPRDLSVPIDLFTPDLIESGDAQPFG